MAWIEKAAAQSHSWNIPVGMNRWIDNTTDEWPEMQFVEIWQVLTITSWRHSIQHGTMNKALKPDQFG